MNDINEVKEKVFGKVGAVGVGKHHFVKEKLTEPFESGDSVIYGFCENCGAYHEYSNQSMLKFLFAMSEKAPQNPSEFFFLQKTCNVCLQGEREVALVRI